MNRPESIEDFVGKGGVIKQYPSALVFYGRQSALIRFLDTLNRLKLTAEVNTITRANAITDSILQGL